MRAVIQRVLSASVTIEGRVTASIEAGLLVLLGVQIGDVEAEAAWLAQKIAALRIFEDEDGRMNRSLLDSSPPVESGPRRAVLVVSQFTLLASCRKGTRPSFNAAATPELAIPMYEAFVRQLSLAIGAPVATGVFGAAMKVGLINDGPVTLVIDSRLRE